MPYLEICHGPAVYSRWAEVEGKLKEAAWFSSCIFRPDSGLCLLRPTFYRSGAMYTHPRNHIEIGTVRLPGNVLSVIQ
jgi:hypothetical protein